MVSPSVIAEELCGSRRLPDLPYYNGVGRWRISIPEDQIAAFYVEVRPSLCAFLRRRKLPVEDVEDIVQEAFVRLLSQSPEGLKADKVKYWLFRVAHNLAIDRQRSQWRYSLDSQVDGAALLAAVPSPDFDPEKIYSDYEQWQVVRDNLAKLTPRQRRAIHLRITGLSYKAIAQRLKGTTPSIAELIRRGLKRLGAHVQSCEV